MDFIRTTYFKCIPCQNLALSHHLSFSSVMYLEFLNLKTVTEGLAHTVCYSAAIYFKVKIDPCEVQTCMASLPQET